MSENLRSQPFESEGSADHSSEPNRGRSGYEGFEGMNYEQRRPSYRPQQISPNKKNSTTNGNGKQNSKP